MKKFALALLVMGVMVLGFGLMTAFAQGSQTAGTDVTVTVTDNNVTMTPTTLPAGVPVTFTFTNNGTKAHAFVIEKTGATNQPLSSGGKTASFDAINAGGNFSTTWTFTDAGDYQLAAYNNGTLEQGLVATFTVGSGSAQAGATASPTAGATSAATTSTTAATSTVSATTTMSTTGAAGSATSTPSAGSSASTSSTTSQTPSSLPRTGGETTNWAAMLLAFGVAALLIGGALTFARRAR